jgi:hypothetical protein
MAEWHVPPDHIAECWSDELFALMVHHFAKRRERERKAIEAPGKEQGRTTVSSSELIERMGKDVEVIGKDG